MINQDSIFKSRDIALPTKVHLVKAMVFPVVMYGCESWTGKKAERRRIDAFVLWCWRRLLRVSSLDCKEIQPLHSKGDQSWVFFWRTDAKAETPTLWPPHAKSWLTGKDSDAGRDWGQEEKGTTEDEMAGWHHRINGREYEWTPGVGDRQRGLVCCNSWGRKELDTFQFSWVTELNYTNTSRKILRTNRNNRCLCHFFQCFRYFIIKIDMLVFSDEGHIHIFIVTEYFNW